MTRIVQLVNECRECPNRMYESGGEYVCRKVQGANHVPRFGPMPEWCPLPVYPTHGVRGTGGNDGN